MFYWMTKRFGFPKKPPTIFQYITILFGCSANNVSLHLKNIFESEELKEDSVTEVFSATATDGKMYKVKHYNLDAIISVGKYF